jgi:hypothetical protein
MKMIPKGFEAYSAICYTNAAVGTTTATAYKGFISNNTTVAISSPNNANAAGEIPLTWIGGATVGTGENYVSIKWENTLAGEEMIYGGRIYIRRDTTP